MGTVCLLLINIIILCIKCGTELDDANFPPIVKNCANLECFSDHWNLVTLIIHLDLRHFWQPWSIVKLVSKMVLIE